MTVAKEVILITAGDPASISTEIIIKAVEAKHINKNVNLSFYSLKVLTKYLDQVCILKFFP